MAVIFSAAGARKNSSLELVGGTDGMGSDTICTLIQPLAALDEFTPEISDMGNGAAEGGETQPQEDAEYVKGARGRHGCVAGRRAAHDVEGAEHPVMIERHPDGVGGHMQFYCGPQHGQHTCTNPIARDKLLAVDEDTGALTPWNPSANSVLGVFALYGVASNGDLLAGGDFTSIGLRKQQGYAQFTP